VLIPPKLVVRKSTQRKTAEPVIPLLGTALQRSTLEENEP